MRRWMLGTILGLVLLSGCATDPVQHVNACKAQTTDALDGIECIQGRMRTDPSTPEGAQARIDFMVLAVRSLRGRVDSGAITREQARGAMEALGRELEGPPGSRPESTSFLSKETLDVIGLPADTAAFSQFVQPSSLAASRFTGSLGGSSSTGADRAPCVTSVCGAVNIRGYYRKDGTYVRPHTRSSRGSGRRR